MEEVLAMVLGSYASVKWKESLDRWDYSYPDSTLPWCIATSPDYLSSVGEGMVKDEAASG